MILQAIDKKCYLDPLWHGFFSNGQKWMITFQDGLPVLIVEAINHKDAIVKKARNLIEDWPIKIVGRKQYSDTMIFPHFDKGAFSAFIFDTKIEGFMPIPDRWTSVMDQPPFDQLKYCWEVQFKVEHIRQYWVEKPHYLNGYLSDFLLGVSISSPYTNQVHIRTLLSRQYPGIHKLSLEEAIRKYGERVPVRRKIYEGRKRVSKSDVR